MIKLKVELEIENDLYRKALETSQDNIRNYENTIELLNNEIHRLKHKLATIEGEYDVLKNKESQMNEIISGVYFAPVKNERGAGRKTLINDETKEKIKAYRAQGLSYRAISDKMNLSLGFVHKCHNS